MRTFLLALLTLVAVGCTNPAAPTLFTCYTQPRVYESPTGVRSLEVDHYESLTPCPAVRIN